MGEAAGEIIMRTSRFEEVCKFGRPPRFEPHDIDEHDV
jgi:hypothetical protein